MPHGVRRRVLAGLAVLTLGARGDDCASWTLAWWTPAWRELHYAEHELLANVSILSLIHISEPTRQAEISYAVFCLKKKNN